jgi:hypothetical protein
LLGLLALAGLGACGGDDTPAQAGATVPKATTPTTAADPYAVPATIDAAYLTKVFAALDGVDGDATRLILRTKNLPPEAAERLASIYGEKEFRVQTGRWLDVLEAGNLAGYKPEPGNLKTSVVRVISSNSQCVFLLGQRDHSAIAVSPPAPQDTYFYLQPLEPIRNRKQFNPTPWMISGEGFNSDGSAPGDPCAP